jgi:hypothetical protein
MPDSPSEYPSIKTTKTLPYRGGTKSWSNRFYLVGGVPADNAAWTTLSDAITAAEKTCYDSAQHITLATGYLAGSDVPVFSKAYSLAGTYVPGSLEKEVPGDCAVMTKFTTDQRTDKNHPIYLFSYQHGAFRDTSATADTLAGTQYNAIRAFHLLFCSGQAGFSDGTNTYHRCGPRGAVALTRITDLMIRHRDFPA